MCFYINNKLTKKELEDNFHAKLLDDSFNGSSFVNGFSHPKTPIITDENNGEIVLGDWGIIPFWSKDKTIQRSTLNAKIETIAEKPSFKSSVNKRCLVLVKGFYEWRWLDEKGKEKEKNFITLADEEVFALGGIYNIWTDKTTGEELKTFSIVTTEANELMAHIHNTKHRMPVVLNKDIRNDWLKDRNIQDFAFPNYEANLLNNILN